MSVNEVRFPVSPDAQRIISVVVVAGSFATLLIAEMFRPLRGRVESRWRHIVRNLTTGGISLAVLTLLQAPVLVPVAAWAEEHRIGLLHLVDWPRPIEIVVALILFDYTLWWWHWANHRVPFLWRFHLPHHIDLDLDASTALRFHFGELTLSIAYRALQIVAIGATTEAVWVWQTILFASILFHHSNVRLPLLLERCLVWLVVTPRMHGIHHSDRLNETNSNWSSLLSVWDVLHGTLRLDVPQEAIKIGVPGYEHPAEVTIGRILLVPFRRQRDDWRESDGELAVRPTVGSEKVLAP